MKVKNKLAVAVMVSLGMGGISYSQVVMPDSSAGKRSPQPKDTVLINKAKSDSIKKSDSLNHTNKKTFDLPEKDTVIPPRNKSGKEIPINNSIK